MENAADDRQPETKPEGVLLLTRSTVLDPLPSIAKRQHVQEFDESYSLIRGSCVYPGDTFRDDIPPDLCFPLSSRTTFGALPQTSPAEEFVWHVVGVDADPFDSKDQKTFHLTSHQGSGRWSTGGSYKVSVSCRKFQSITVRTMNSVAGSSAR